MAMNICKRCYVSGKVQGVFFRASARSRAQALRVTGYAKNLDDGRVEVLACGEPANVEALINWLWDGSRGARIDDVNVQDADDVPPHDFKTC